MKILFFSVICLVLSACSYVIPEHQLVDIHSLDEQTALSEISNYNNKILLKANLQSNIVFKFRGRTMTALGLTNLDEKNKSYQVAALNPMGITLFQLNVKNNQVLSSYIIPQFTPGEKNNGNKDKADKAAEMISKDIAHIYFNRTLDTLKNSIQFNKYDITFTSDVQDNQFYKYIFSGNPLKLSTKIKFENKKKVWSTDYYQYTDTELKEMPFKIIFQNHKYGYLLEIDTNKISTK